MRVLPVLCLLLVLGACEERESPLELASVESPPAIGLQLRELPPSVLKTIGLRYGLVVVKTSGLAERAGLRMGDVVYGINKTKIGSMEEFRHLIATPAVDNRLGLLVRRGAEDFSVALDLGALPPPEAPKDRLPPRDTLLRT